jgi:hypothetical protein
MWTDVSVSRVAATYKSLNLYRNMCPSAYRALKYTTLRQLDLFPSSIEGVGIPALLDLLESADWVSNIFYALVYLTTYPVCNLYGAKWRDGWWIGENLEGSLVVLSSRHPIIYLEGLRKTTKNLTRDTRDFSRDSNRPLPKHKSGTYGYTAEIPLPLTRFSWFFFSHSRRISGIMPWSWTSPLPQHLWLIMQSTIRRRVAWDSDTFFRKPQ